MIDDLFIFDCVIHLHDMSDDNLDPRRADSRSVRDMQVGMGELLRPIHGDPIDYATRMSVAEMHRLVFEESPTDMAMAQVVHEPGERHPVTIEAAALDEAIRWVNGRMRSHGGGIELVDTNDGAVSVRFTGMCCGCPWKALTWFGTVQDALLGVAGVESVDAPGTRISDEAESRLRALHLHRPQRS